jgi:hypothetical protein
VNDDQITLPGPHRDQGRRRCARAERTSKFDVSVPQTGEYQPSVFDGSYCQAADVSGLTNIFVRVDGGDPQQVWIPCGYQWVIWNHADTSIHLTSGAHQISLSTAGANGDAGISSPEQGR